MKERKQRTPASDNCQRIRPSESASWSCVTEDLFVWQDSCNVYLLHTGDHAVVIDPGTGRWVRSLGELGVCHVDAIVLTHTDRDQCCCLYRDSLPSEFASIQLVVPATSRSCTN